MLRKASLLLFLVLALPLIAPATARAQEAPATSTRTATEEGGGNEDGRVGKPIKVPEVGIKVESDDPGLSRTVVIILLFTIASVAPAILLLMTSFTRFVVVMGLTRNAIGLQGIPPNQVLIGLAMFMTFFVMSPVLGQINKEAVQPALDGKISTTVALERGFKPLRTFMLEQTDEDDLELFTSMTRDTKPRNESEISATALVPAYVISELRTAFLIGFIIFIPFLVIDLVVSAAMMSLGMMMVPPIVISLPLKLLLFVLVDGWGLIVKSVLGSVTGAG
ncbi:MAG: flagellar type III secretion system pore protein FliP [Actinomycetota bacterium]